VEELCVTCGSEELVDEEGAGDEDGAGACGTG